ncbi:MAG TPA: ABC transporter substrate-binding protein [Beijerinckiaceae bacterium]|jgi:peptide/nickel transport system substrate-binding protein
MKRMALLAALAVAVLPAPAIAQTELRIGLQDDPDTLDPATSWSFVGRHVLQSLCDKLVDIDREGRIVPMLAAAWSWSEDGRALTLTLRPNLRFHDGEPLDAEAVRYNLDRALNLKGSRRRAEIDAIARVEAPDPATVRLVLKEPSVPLLAALSDRAGMMVSPKAAEAAGAEFTRRPVCSGPYKFVEHRAQDRIVLERFGEHWRAGDYAFDRLVFRGMPDSNVRLLNLRAGQLDLIERISPTDVGAAEKDPKLRIVEGPSLGYFGVTFNIGNGPEANPTFAKHRLVREAFDLAVDREALNQVVFEGRYEAGNQPFPPSSPFYDRSRPVRPRDVAAAKAKLKEAGAEGVAIDLLVPTDPQRQQVAQVLQAMAGEAGIRLNVVATELMTLLDRAKQGKFQAHLVGWSGRTDPDLNITPLLACGAAGNDGRFCDPALDAILAEARKVADPEARKAKYRDAVAVLLRELPIIYLYHAKWQFALAAAVQGFSAYPDGIIRLDGVRR